MRTCRKCGETKPESEYYKRNSTNDGLDYYCKSCRRQDSENRKGTSKLAWSTEKAMKLLMANGVRVSTGKTVGKPGKDIVAYGFLTIEAKSALHRPGHNVSVFGFTKAQRLYRCDYYVLIFRDTERVFVVPGDSAILDTPGQSLCIAENDPRLAPYENAYQIIKDRVIRDIQESAPVDTVLVYSGTYIHEVSI